MDARTLDAEQHAQVKAGPGRASGAAVSTARIAAHSMQLSDHLRSQHVEPALVWRLPSVFRTGGEVAVEARVDLGFNGRNPGIRAQRDGLVMQVG